MDANFWADVINNMLGGLGLILGASVSDNIRTALETVTNAASILPDPDLILPFVRAIGFLALLMAIPVSMVNLIAGAIFHRAGYIQRAIIDFAGTYFIAAFGLTIYSVLTSLVNVYNQTVTELAKVVTGSENDWFDSIMTAWNVANPAQAGLNFFVAQLGGGLLVVQMTILNLAVIPTILFVTLAFILRDRPVARTFLTLAIAVLLVTLLARAAVATWLAFAVWLFNWVPATGVSETLLLAGTLLIAGFITPVLLILFFAGSLITRTEIVGGRKGKAERKNKDKSAESEEDAANTESARRRYGSNPSTKPDYDSSTSPSVREKARAMKDRGQEIYTKGKGFYDSGIEKTEKTRRTAHTVVMVSTAVESAAPMVAVKFAAVPYVAPIALGVGAAATGTKHVATKVESSASRVLDANTRVKAPFKHDE